MLQIGITGGIGAGKSIVCKMFSALGIPFYDADSAAKRIMVDNKALVTQIKQAFGDDAYFPDGKLNRDFLAKQVFANGDKVTMLNGLVHPAVASHFTDWVHAQNAPYVLKEAALLFEAGSYKKLDKTILIHAPVEVRVVRVMERDPFRTRQEIEAILGKQWPEEQKIALADHVIVNDGIQPVLPQVIVLHHAFLKFRKSDASGK